MQLYRCSLLIRIKYCFYDRADGGEGRGVWNDSVKKCCQQCTSGME